MSLADRRTVLLGTVEGLFRQVPPPAVLTVHAYPDEEEDIERLLSGRGWWEVPEANLVELSNSALLPLLTDEASVYYLPAYLAALLRGGFDDTAADFLLYGLENDEQGGLIMASLTAAQRGVMRKALGILAKDRLAGGEPVAFSWAAGQRLRGLVSEAFLRSETSDDPETDFAPPDVDPSHLPKEFRTRRAKRARRWEAVWPYGVFSLTTAPWSPDLDLRRRVYYLPFALEWLLCQMHRLFEEDFAATVAAVRKIFFGEDVKASLTAAQRHVATFAFRALPAWS